jgi:hypothetical protein
VNQGSYMQQVIKLYHSSDVMALEMCWIYSQQKQYIWSINTNHTTKLCLSLNFHGVKLYVICNQLNSKCKDKVHLITCHEGIEGDNRYSSVGTAGIICTRNHDCCKQI